MADERGAREFFFIKKKFGEHYSKGAPTPPELARREFGFGWEKKIDYRHKAFATPEEFRYFLATEAPLYSSYSTAYYQLPAARPMENKGYLGSDVAFDLDKQYLDEAHEHNEVICPYCLDRAREDTLRLVEDFILGDFGFSRKEISANYSGSKGFHVHVRGDAVRQLPQQARVQLAEYVDGGNIDPSRFVTGTAPEEKGRRRAKQRVTGPGRDAQGWGKRVFDHCSSFVSGASLESLREYGLASSQAVRIVEEKEFVLAKMAEGNWDAAVGLEKLWKNLVPEAVAKGRVVIDRSVTIDQARLIRLPDTLHGDTGLLAKTCDLRNFDPLRDAIAFGEGMARVRAEKDFTVPLASGSVEAKANAAADVPMAAAMLLLCKKKAALVEEYA